MASGAALLFLNGGIDTLIPPAGPSLSLHVVASPPEITALTGVARRLAELAKPQGEEVPAMAFSKREDWADPPRSGAIVLASMSVHLAAQGEDASELKTAWLDRIQALKGNGSADIFLMTVFPFIAKAERRADPYGTAARLQHIRRLNLMAIELSHETGASIIDVARWFSAIGADLLQTDYRATGRRAAWVVTEAALFTMLNADLDGFFCSLPHSASATVLDAMVRRLEGLDAAHDRP